MRLILIALLLTCLFFSCAEKKKEFKPEAVPVSNLSGKELSKIHCARCHAFVKPESLPKLSWKQDVLPSMAHRMGIYKGDHQPDSLFDPGLGGKLVRMANIYPEKPELAKVDWEKIVDYYVENAPNSLVPPKRVKAITSGLKHFKYRETSYSHRPPLTSLVKILPDNRGIVFGDGKRDINHLTFLTPELKKNYEIGMKKTPIHYYEKEDTLYLATVGKSLFPHDDPQGALHNFVINKPGQPYQRSNSKVILEDLQRPVFMAYGDLNNDGLDDIVACEFGNLTGKLVWFENQGNNQYAATVLNNRPGAVTAIIKDTNKDGLNDILVLMAQGDEGVFLYENLGDGTFTEKRVLSFPPLYGSQYIELVDFNKDGFDDIIYVSGDNADKTPFLKEYHGIYIYLNDGNFNFAQAYFYQLNGAYKAIPKDFDLDGDLDIAAISFFPDYANYPEESFVYLENKGDLEFDDYSFPEATKGRWIVIDAADMDSDGDIDLALGSFVYFVAKGDTTGLGKKWLTSGPSVIVLENTTR